MVFSTIRIEGAILSPEILSTVAQGESPGQTAPDFGLKPGSRVKDEIARSWADALDYWRIFRRKLEASSGAATTETRKFWIVPLLNLLGYDPVLQQRGEEIQQRIYSISHRDRGELPIHIVGWHLELDKKNAAAAGPRLSPHGLVQEYLNLTDHTYGLITNGSSLRLLRNNLRLNELWCVEFDLEGMMEQEIFADFAVLYRLLHASRLPTAADKGTECWLEKYHLDTIEAGSRIRDGLSRAVEMAILGLANGFLTHPANDALRQQLSTGKLTAQTFYQCHLRLVYRLLFLLVAEERDILYDKAANPDHRKIYGDYYSLSRLRRLADLPHLAVARYSDAWASLLETFRLFEPGDYGGTLGLQPLGGTLFERQAIEVLETCTLDNRTLLDCLRMLSVFESSQARRQIRVNYKDLDVQEFGSVYEGLLDLHPVIDQANSAWTFTFSAGTDRKTTGSYYTRPELVRELVRSALEPVIADRLNGYQLPQQREEAEQALLAIRICDPAVGSGHMLIAAARQLALALAKVRTGEDQPGLEPFRAALRHVIQHCLYGVDFNAGAVELCQVALWIESHNPGKSLSFFGHKIRQGNSLVGVMDLDVLAQGIPDEAFNAVSGDDAATARLLKKANRELRKRGQYTLSFQQVAEKLHDQQADFARQDRALDALPQDSVADTKVVQTHYQQTRKSSAWWTDWQACNLYTAAFFHTYLDPDAAENPGSERLANYLQNPAATDGRLIGHANQLQSQHGFFHWPLEFPAVFEAGGFDVVLGNPPWERIKLQEEEFFKTRDVAIANAANKAARGRLIRELPLANPDLHRAYIDALHTAEAQSKFIRSAGRNLLTATGDINTYSIFAELDRRLLNPRGRAGVIVPTGIATDDSTKAFFGDLITTNSLVSLFDFENREAIFEEVHRSYKFCLLTMAGDALPKGYEAQFAFFLTNVMQLQDSRRVFALTADDFLRLNPNTKTCPIFRTRQDAELTARIYRKLPILINEESGENPWGIKFMTMFHMSNDSHLFHTKEDMRAAGYRLESNHFVKSEETYLPLYEGKFIWHYDHRFGSYEGADSRNSTLNPTLEQYQKPDYVTQPWYWVHDEEVYLAAADVPLDFKRAYRQRDWDKLKRAADSWFAHYEQALDSEIPMTEYVLDGLEASRLTKLGKSESWTEVYAFIGDRCPKWLFGFRDVARSTDERTFVSSATSLSAVNHKMPLYSGTRSVAEMTCFLSMVNSLPFDFITRFKIGGASMTFFNVKQFPVLPPEYYSAADFHFIIPRALELIYTAWEMQPYLEDIWAEADETLKDTLVAQWQDNQRAAEHSSGNIIATPFVWDENRRATLQAELDAYYAKLYGLSEQDLRYILDPQDVYGTDFPGETFRVLKEKDIRSYGEYRTQRLVMEAFARLPDAVGAHIPEVYVPKPVKVVKVKSPSATLSLPKPKAKPKTIGLPAIEFTDNMKDWGIDSPMYNIATATDILWRSGLDVNTEKVGRWFKGLSEHDYEGVSGKKQKRALEISFHGLIELVVIGTLYDAGLKFNRILKFRGDLEKRSNKKYPFATNDVKTKLKKVGHTLVFYFSEGPVTLDGTGQFNFEVIQHFFDDLVFNPSGVVQQIMPSRGRNKIVIDPRIGDGKEVIIDKGVPVSVIATYYHGEKSIATLEREFHLTREEILAAVNYLDN